MREIRPGSHSRPKCSGDAIGRIGEEPSAPAMAKDPSERSLDDEVGKYNARDRAKAHRELAAATGTFLLIVMESPRIIWDAASQRNRE